MEPITECPERTLVGFIETLQKEYRKSLQENFPRALFLYF
ncbi:hypothetical protein EnPhBC-611_gp83 [Enterococcus phage BC611]|uniref:Uncharacterized protein n=1 Tax=Enterococcus phage BC611 TaxID=1173135 RepID=K0IS00_9CAUD|nr:hypothetical protein EnPhBC-611_gp83 [Enterococcus phage BC611]BAM44924.1 unnamed protein product [Enterococcus phage BC611]